MLGFVPMGNFQMPDKRCMLTRFLTRFLKDCRGGIAPMLALTAIPLVGSVGVAVDFTRANAARTVFQSALDSTALMLAKTAATQSSAQR